MTDPPTTEKTVIPEARPAVSEQDWQEAQGRLVLYLSLLDMPALEALETALEALRLSQQALQEGGTGHPVTVAMQNLRRLLEEKRPGDRLSKSEDAFRSICPWFAPPVEDGVPDDPRSTPLLNRGCMVPEKH
jgi:hypothetical protein